MHSGKVGEEPEELALRRGGGGAVAWGGSGAVAWRQQVRVCAGYAEADQRGGAAAAVAGWRRHRAAATQAQSTGGAAAEPTLA
jgi:hypothetical protein